MSAPVSDDESSEHQKYAPKRLREQPRMPPAPQLRVASPPMSPSHAQVQGDRGETSGLPSSEGDLEDEVPRRLYEPEPVSAAATATPRILCAEVDQLACDRSGVHRADRDDCHNHETTLAQCGVGTAASSPQASRLSGRLAANNAPADTVTGIAAASGAQQSSSVQAQPASSHRLRASSSKNPSTFPYRG